jgi:hypothetical protein
MKANDCNIPRTFCNTGIQQLQHRKQKKSHNKVRKELPARAPSAVAGAPPVHNPPPPRRAPTVGVIGGWIKGAADPTARQRVDQGRGGTARRGSLTSGPGEGRRARLVGEWSTGGGVGTGRVPWPRSLLPPHRQILP